MAKGQANFNTGSEEARRKKNFFTSMRNNADVKRRFGGDVNKAYEAMRKEAARKGTLTRSDSANTRRALANAAQRRTRSTSRDAKRTTMTAPNFPGMPARRITHTHDPHNPRNSIPGAVRAVGRGIKGEYNKLPGPARRARQERQEK